MNISEFVAFYRDRFHLLGGDLAGFMELERVVADSERVFPDEFPTALFQRERLVIRSLFVRRLSATFSLLSLLEKTLVRAVDALHDILQRLAR